MEGAVRPVDDRERPVPVLLDLLVVVGIHLAGLDDTHIYRLALVDEPDVGLLVLVAEVAVGLDFQLCVELP